MPNPYGWGDDEPQIKPKDQGGDTVATFSQKIYNLFDILFDTLNSYPWSTATQSDAGYMSSDDKKAVDGIADLGTFNKMFFSQTSGSYIAPRTGVYRITLKGGGGGGGGSNTTQYRLGAGGGEGGELTFYVSLTAGQSYPYVIGAGGTAGTDSTTSPTDGGNGGTSSFNAVYTVSGGNGGNRGSTASMGFGGAGGLSYSAPAGAVVYFKPGIAGQSNVYGDQSNNKWLQYGCSGGGRGGSAQQGATGIYGGGGRGTFEVGFGGTFHPPTAGGAGYILIEYAG